MATLNSRRPAEKTSREASRKNLDRLKAKSEREYSIGSEMRAVGERSNVLSDAYEGGVKGFLDEIRDFIHILNAEHINRDSCLEGRAAVYRALGIEHNPFHGKEILDNKNFFDLVVHGRLKETILELVGAQDQDAVIRMKPVLVCSSDVYIASVETWDVFVRAASVRPELFAVALLDLMDVITPEIRNVPYAVPGMDEELEYGLSRHLADSRNVKRAASLRAFARDGHLANLVLKNFPEFCQQLGYVFEVCRKLGIQDRHSRNTWVVEKHDGSLAVGLIDLDIVGCYPDESDYVLNFAHDLHFIASSIDFADVYGGEVRAGIPNGLKKRVKGDKQAAGRRSELLERMLGEFLKGAEKAHMLFASSEMQKKIEELFAMHDGKPVGIAQTRKERESTGSSVNGEIHRLIENGSDAGRFRFSKEYAWGKGFLSQMGGSMHDFWEKTFDIAPAWRFRILAY